MRLYFSDFGLAMSSRFDLSRVESEFFREHASHDVCYAVTQLVNWLVAALHPVVDRRAFIRACAEGADPAGLPPSAATIVKRYALIASVMNEFYWKLHTEDRTARYPVAEIESALAAAGFEGGWPLRWYPMACSSLIFQRPGATPARNCTGSGTTGMSGRCTWRPARTPPSRSWTGGS
jgi:hypothetical protein